MLYQAKVVASSGSTVRMRTAADSSASVAKTIKLGQTVDVVQELDGWLRIVHEGTTGYMMSKFLEKIEGSE